MRKALPYWAAKRFPDVTEEVPVPKDVTEALHAWMKGDTGASERFLPAVYDELRHLAGRALRDEHRNHT